MTRVMPLFFNHRDGLPKPVVDQATADALLELRKAGLRVVSDTSALTDNDAALSVTFITERGTFASRLQLRMDVKQAATLARTGAPAAVVTWYYEEDRRDVNAEREAGPMLDRAINRFLSAWLGANGR